MEESCGESNLILPGKEKDITTNEGFALKTKENEDMTENSGDSGFTEFSSSNSSEPQKSDETRTNDAVLELTSSGSEDVKKSTEKSTSVTTCLQAQQSSSAHFASDDDDSDDDDDDYNDSDGAKPDILQWVRQQMMKGVNPRDVIKLLLHNFHVPEDINESMLWRLISYAVQPQRERLDHVRTLSDAVQQIKQAKNIIILTGAGVSVSCGIPDFRSRDGVYSRLSKEFPNLPDPQSMFDIKFFSQDPRPFFKFAKEIYPGVFRPSPSHRFIKKMEERNVLLRNYTQNIDTLERAAGITKLIECHGSFATATCTRCKFKIQGDVISEDILNQRIPICFKCNPDHRSLSISSALDESLPSEQLTSLVQMGIFKPDIVFFGEELPDDFHNSIEIDRTKCDLLIVIGSSLKVRPVAMIPNLIQSNVPQILINREPLSHMNFDINLYGDSDVIVDSLYRMIVEDDTDEELCWMETPLTESEMISLPSRESSETAGPAESDGTPPTRAAESNNDNENLTKLLPSNTFAQISSSRCFLFPGAEVTWDNLNGTESDDSDEGEFSDDDMDNEEEEELNEETTTKPAEIVPDIDNGLSNDQVPAIECSQQPRSSDIPSPISSASQLRSSDDEKVENITDIQADEATKEPIDDCLESVPAKRIRLSTDVSPETEKNF